MTSNKIRKMLINFSVLKLWPDKFYIATVIFRLFKFYARLACKIFCRKIIINKPEWLHVKGPLLLACNHPSSFLDGIILTLLFEENVYSLARGDAFKKRWHEKILRWLHLLPVYRTSEGTENLEHNYTTFQECKEIFQQNGIVIIFSEARTINEWHLRPLRKGTARLATSAWLEGLDLTVLPVGLNYNRYRNFGKNVFINFGEPLNKEEVMQHLSDGKMFLSFNEQLKDELQKLVFEIDPSDIHTLKQKTTIPIPLLKRVALFIPVIIGFILHAPFYFAAKAINKKYFDNDHFDSTLLSMLTLVYPFYLLLFYVISAIYIGWMEALLVFIIMPFSAWSCVQLKRQW